ncbi:MAG: ABC transporter permease [Anaerolineae bacterium]|nr:ABC transporter permease [Anaerolineae bacterium]MDW8068795.1 ABC transporter permease [Anaerolineae bacterium]
MNGRKIWTIARHEYLTNLRRAGFIVMTALIPALGLVALVLTALLLPRGDAVANWLERQFDVGRKPIGVVDHSGYFTPILPEYRETFVLYEDPEAAEAALRAGELQAVLVIGEDYLGTGRITALTRESFGEAAIADSRQVRNFLIAHLLAGRVDPAFGRRAADPTEGLQTRVFSGTGQEWGGGMLFTFLIPYLLALFLVMTIFASSGYLLQSVAEEKENRIVEIIISSVRPTELMAGKVLGLGALGLTQVLIWLASAWGFTGGMATLLALVGRVGIPTRVFVLGVVYYLLGYLLYAVLMAGVGALGTTMRESQQLAGIFSFIAVIPYMLAGFLMVNPNAPLARAFSFFPLTAPTTMMLRIPLGEVPWVDVAGSIGVLLLSIPAALWFGAKLFRVGLLIYGKRPTMREIWRILRS